MKSIEESSQARVEQIRAKSSEEIRNAKQKYTRDITKENEFGQKRIEQQREQNEKRRDR